MPHSSLAEPAAAPPAILDDVGAASLPRSVRWRDWSGSGLEHAVLSATPESIETQSAVIGGPVDGGFAAVYSLRLDAAWNLQEARFSELGTGRTLHLRREPGGAWFEGDGRPLPELQDATEVDLPVTPLTNTLPIRRLGLEVGQSAEITVAYVEIPGLTVTANRQRYTRLSAAVYKLEAVGSTFARDITVDEHGLVIYYPGLFQRIW